jgi:hypothetical protein
MGSYTRQVIGDVSVGTKTKTFTVPDADVNRMVAWAKWRFTPEGQPELNTTQALLALAQYEMDQIRAAVRAYEHKLAKDAVAKPPPIEAI